MATLRLKVEVSPEALERLEAAEQRVHAAYEELTKASADLRSKMIELSDSLNVRQTTDI